MDLFKIVPRIIAMVFITIIVFWSLIGILTVKGCRWVQKDGLKGVSEQVWNGTNSVPPAEGLK